MVLPPLALLLCAGAMTVALGWLLIGENLQTMHRIERAGGIWHGQRGARLAHFTSGIRWACFDRADTGPLTPARWARIKLAINSDQLRHVKFIGYDVDMHFVQEFGQTTRFPIGIKWITLQNSRVDPVAVHWTTRNRGILNVTLSNSSLNPAVTPADQLAMDQISDHPDVRFK